MGQGDLPTPRGGPFRRRREKRQLEQLSQASKRNVAPRPATAHVRVVEDQAPIVIEGQADAAGRELEPVEPGSLIDDSPDSRTTGFHVRPVPIDEPIGE
jgi:hypothetical protein